LFLNVLSQNNEDLKNKNMKQFHYVCKIKHLSHIGKH
jgi:hypothetical protein